MPLASTCVANGTRAAGSIGVERSRREITCKELCRAVNRAKTMCKAEITTEQLGQTLDSLEKRGDVCYLNGRQSVVPAGNWDCSGSSNEGDEEEADGGAYLK